MKAFKIISILSLLSVLCLFIASCQSDLSYKYQELQVDHEYLQAEYEDLEDENIELRSELEYLTDQEPALEYYARISEKLGFLTYDQAYGVFAYLEPSTNVYHSDYFCGYAKTDTLKPFFTSYTEGISYCTKCSEDILIDLQSKLYHSFYGCIPHTTSDYKTLDFPYLSTTSKSALERGYKPCPICN